MYKGIKVKLIDCRDLERLQLEPIINNNSIKFEKKHTDLLAKLESALLFTDIIDGRLLAEKCFPNEKFDIFLSHSHKDKQAALGFALQVEKRLGLRVFIDSQFWDYADHLIKLINKKFAYINGEYDTEMCIENASNVYLLLNTALQKMIDQAECFLFLESENSTIKDVTSLKNATYSPWIMSELEFSRNVRRTVPNRLKEFKENVLSREMYEGVIDKAHMVHNAPTAHLQEVSFKSLYNWLYCGKFKLVALNRLYQIARIENTQFHYQA